MLIVPRASVSFQTLEAAFGPSSLGILIVKDLPNKFVELRQKLLSYASYLANLPSHELGNCYNLSTRVSLLFLEQYIAASSSLLESLACPQAKYLSGWSHGKEALKAGKYDTLKGSYYVNCAFYKDKDISKESTVQTAQFPEFTAPNVWPAVTSLPGFQATFQELCTLIIDVAALVARACDRYAAHYIEEYEAGYLERVVNTSLVTKARLLHYFPPAVVSKLDGDDEAAHPLHSSPATSTETTDDSWCATHIDHGCLTGLTSAMYIDESASPPQLSQGRHHTTTVPVLPYLEGPPDPDTGLYIHARDSTVTKVSIPADCLAFQTGEALELITKGKFRAVPHFVRAGRSGQNGRSIARNTLAVFTQPNLDEVVDAERGITFGRFSREVVGRFG